MPSRQVLLGGLSHSSRLHCNGFSFSEGNEREQHYRMVRQAEVIVRSSPPARFPRPIAGGSDSVSRGRIGGVHSLISYRLTGTVRRRQLLPNGRWQVRHRRHRRFTPSGIVNRHRHQPDCQLQPLHCRTATNATHHPARSTLTNRPVQHVPVSTCTATTQPPHGLNFLSDVCYRGSSEILT